MIEEELPNYERQQTEEFFDILDVERLGYINVHQLVALMNFSRLHRGNSIDEVSSPLPPPHLISLLRSFEHYSKE